MDTLNTLTALLIVGTFIALAIVLWVLGNLIGPDYAHPVWHPVANIN